MITFSVPGIITMTDEEAQEHFDNFFEDVFAECEDKVSIFLHKYCILHIYIHYYLHLVWRN